MKKIIYIVLWAISIIVSPWYSFWETTETVGIGDIIFEEKQLPEIEHGYLINDLSYTLIKLHLTIADKDIQQANYQWETLATIKKLKQLIQQDIIETLYLSEDKHKTLWTYLTECNNELQKGESIVTYMKQEMKTIKDDREVCINQKWLSDEEYFDAIERYDQNTMDVSISDSIHHEQCITEKRIQYNSKLGIINKMVFYLGILQKKYDILFVKQEIVAKEFTIFKDNILPDLNEIDKILKQYTI